MVLLFKVDALVIANQLANTSAMVLFCVCTGTGCSSAAADLDGAWDFSRKNDERTCTAQAARQVAHGYTLNHENPSKLPAQAMPVGSLGGKCHDHPSLCRLLLR